MVKFYKMHSLGNDFMVLDAVTEACSLTKDQIPQWADRNEGIGFDQLLIIAPPQQPDADFHYQIFNADGSESEQCGNGTRCVALLARQLNLSAKKQLVWHSKGGRIHTRLLADRNPIVVETMLPAPSLDPDDVPFVSAAATNTDRLTVDGIEVEVTAVSTGNPHGVVLVDNVSNLDVATLGRQLSTHSAFPYQANIGFCQVVDRGFIRLQYSSEGWARLAPVVLALRPPWLQPTVAVWSTKKSKFHYPEANSEFIGLALANRLPWQAAPPWCTPAKSI